MLFSLSALVGGILLIVVVFAVTMIIGIQWLVYRENYKWMSISLLYNLAFNLCTLSKSHALLIKEKEGTFQ